MVTNFLTFVCMLVLRSRFLGYYTMLPKRGERCMTSQRVAVKETICMQDRRILFLMSEIETI